MKTSDYQSALIFLAYLVTILAVLGALIAVDRVEEQSSFGLQAILAGLGAIGAAVLATMPRPKAAEKPES